MSRPPSHTACAMCGAQDFDSQGRCLACVPAGDSLPTASGRETLLPALVSNLGATGAVAQGESPPWLESGTLPVSGHVPAGSPAPLAALRPGVATVPYATTDAPGPGTAPVQPGHSWLPPAGAGSSPWAPPDPADEVQLGGAALPSSPVGPTRIGQGAAPGAGPEHATLPYEATQALPGSGAMAAAAAAGAGGTAAEALAFDATAAVPASGQLLGAGRLPFGLGRDAAPATRAETQTTPPVVSPGAITQPADRIIIEAVDTPPPRAAVSGSSDSSLVGEQVAGRFQVISLLGAGGMGRVYEAEQIGLGRRVALKVLHPHMAASEVHKQRFHQEARAASRLRHPGSVAVFDFGEWDGQLYIAMELLRGQSVEQLIQREAPLPPERAMDLTLQICEVLAAAHEHGVLHRDLKPGNVLLHTDDRGGERVKVVDFGLALLVDERRDKRLTTEGMVLGTPAYMSPEQFQDLPLDARSDLYSLGVILYEMLCGKLPFSGNTSTYLLQLLYLEAPPPSEARPELTLPEGLEAFVMALMAKAPELRPATAADACARLRAVQEQAAAGPDEAEQAQRRALLLGDRQERATAFGLPERAAETQTGAAVRPPDEETLAVVESINDPTRSTTVALRAEGYLVAHFPNTAALLREAPGGWAAGIIVVLDPPAEANLELLREQGLFALSDKSAVVVVGPDDSFEIMTRALELGAADYLPEADVRRVLRRSVERLLRRRRRQRRRAEKIQ